MRIEEIKTHELFKDIKWDILHKIDAPIIPETVNDIDTHNFKSETSEHD